MISATHASAFQKTCISIPFNFFINGKFFTGEPFFHVQKQEEVQRAKSDGESVGSIIHGIFPLQLDLCEQMHCPDERALFSLPNVVVTA